MDPTLMLFYKHLTNSKLDDAKNMILDGAINPAERYTVPISPLSFVVEKGWYDFVVLLLDKGADANFGGRNGHFPLFSATKNKGPNGDEIMKLLLARGADVNCKYMNGNSAFLEVVKHKDLSKVKILLEAGADIHAYNNGGDTAIHLAAIQGNINMAKELISHGCQVDNTKFLNTNKWVKFTSGLSPLHYTTFGVMGGHPAMTELLLQHGAKVDVQIPENGRTPLHLCAMRDSTLTAKVLIRNGCQLNPVSTDNNELKTPLHKAIDCNHVGMVVELITAGADLNITCQHYMTPLMLALSSHLSNKAIIVRCLLQEGCNVNLKTTTVTHFDVAIKMDAAENEQTHMPYTVMLLKAGYKMDERELMSAKNQFQPKRTLEYLCDHANNTDSLQQICRLTIRSLVNGVVSVGVNELTLPQRLKVYVNLCDIRADFKWD